MLKALRQMAFVAVLSGTLVLPLAAQAKGPAACGVQGPSKSNGELDNFRTAKVNAVGGAGLTVFNNNENKLPAAGKGETYYEFDLGANGFGGRGAHRAVILVLAGKKNTMVHSYFTQDHYATFCEID